VAESEGVIRVRRARSTDGLARSVSSAVRIDRRREYSDQSTSTLHRMAINPERFRTDSWGTEHCVLAYRQTQCSKLRLLAPCRFGIAARGPHFTHCKLQYRRRSPIAAYPDLSVLRVNLQTSQWQAGGESLHRSGRSLPYISGTSDEARDRLSPHL